jgi:hypothetical protein
MPKYNCLYLCKCGTTYIGECEADTEIEVRELIKSKIKCKKKCGKFAMLNNVELQEGGDVNENALSTI